MPRIVFTEEEVGFIEAFVRSCTNRLVEKAQAGEEVPEVTLDKEIRDIADAEGGAEFPTDFILDLISGHYDSLLVSCPETWEDVIKPNGLLDREMQKMRKELLAIQVPT